MREIKDLLGELLRKEEMGELGELVRIRNEWDKMFDGAKNEKTRPYKLQKGRLYIGAESHAWVQELQYDVEDIKKQINERLGIEIREVRIKKINLE